MKLIKLATAATVRVSDYFSVHKNGFLPYILKWLCIGSIWGLVANLLKVKLWLMCFISFVLPWLHGFIEDKVRDKLLDWATPDEK